MTEAVLKEIEELEKNKRKMSFLSKMSAGQDSY